MALFLINPKSGRQKKRRSTKRRPRNLRRASPMARKRRKAPRRRKRARSRRSYVMSPKRRRSRKRPSYAMNPRRRSYRRKSRSSRRYRRNPAPVMSILNTLGYAAGGFMGTKFLGNVISPMLGDVGTQPILRIGVKLGIAYLAAWGGEAMLGRRAFMPMMVGGSIEVIQDAVRTFVAPYFPALAAYEQPLELYYQNQTALAPPDGGEVGQYFPGYESAYGEIGTYMSM